MGFLNYKPNIDRHYRLPRIWSNIELKKIAQLFNGDIINVSASDDGDKQGDFYKNYFLNAQNYYYSNYVGYRGLQNIENEFQIDLSKNIPDSLLKRFDVAFNHTTLEHIFNVQQAFANICKLSRNVVIIIVPFVQIQHCSPSYGDYWRFTPECMRLLFKENGLEVIYESASDISHSSIYLFFVGSYHPDVWIDIMPSYQIIDSVGSWIGETKKNMIFNFGKQIIKKIFH